MFTSLAAGVLAVNLFIGGLVNTGTASGVGPPVPPSYVQTTGVDLGGLPGVSGAVPTK